MTYLDEALIEYSQSDAYPFHMPGHKRRDIAFPNPYTIDITEIDGFDNLHHAAGILSEAQQRAAALYGSSACYYLVNGSSCGLLAAISAAVRKRDKVLVARNCHKAVYHALFLNELDAEFLYPQITKNDLQGQITVKQVEDALYEHPDAAAVIITSPTYEGIISDVKGIARVCHAKNVPLIVDEAHGAHLGFGGDFPENAVRLDADAVIMSLHKTLPSFTQTALLHLNGSRIKKDRVQRYLGIYETSSPSYIFMAGMDACVRLLEKQGKTLFADYRRRLDAFYQNVSNLASLHVMTRQDLNGQEAYDWDDGKIVIFTGNHKNFTGERLHRLLLEQYHLQMEMVSGNYVLAMTSILDTDEGFARLEAALHEIDKKLTESTDKMEKAEKEESQVNFTARMYQKNPRQMQIYQAAELPQREVTFDEAVGEMSADYVFLYPPGIPLLVPGEIITRKFIEKIRECQRKGLMAEGQANLERERINIVYF